MKRKPLDLQRILPIDEVVEIQIQPETIASTMTAMEDRGFYLSGEIKYKDHEGTIIKHVLKFKRDL